MKKKHAFFSFSRRERFGSTLLIFSFILIWVLPRFLPRLFPPPPLPEPAAEQQLVHFILADSTKRPADTLFAFDPNIADAATFVLLGLSEKTAHTIERYREKGGKFRKKEDLAKIYGLPEEDYLRLEPFIQIPSQQPNNLKTQRPIYSIKTIKPVDINLATEEEWQTLRGIGPGYAARIRKFRDKLGGFSSIAQVGETFGLPDSVFQKIEPQLVLSPIFRKLHVNTASEEELAGHPYLSDRQAHILVLFRENHGPFSGVDDLRQIRAIPDSTFQKLTPYLSYEKPE